ncbi:cytochrome P450 7A1 isoform X2 [Sardina pilchardus]|uniref:cytochrome P450 7A1 isoform X2 n=1 Tax=Sardina pilchardus TaxID=27697 RepID=UPI002E1474F0
MSALLIGILTILLPLFLFCLFLEPRKRRPGEPPLEAGWIPFLGVALDYGRNPLAFLRETEKKCGKAFTCKIAGKYFTFITDPFSFPAVVRQGKNLDFQKFAIGFSQRVFGHADFTAPAYTSSYREVHSLFRQTLQGSSLTELTESILGNLQAVLRQNLPQGEDWEEEGLQDFSYRIMFEAGFLTLFGQEVGMLEKGDNRSAQANPCMRQVAHDFLVFDHAFPKMAAGLPIHLCVRAWLAREALAEKFHHVRLQRHQSISALIKRRMDAFDSMQLDERGKARTHVCMLWASQANTLPTAFWSLYHMLSSPEALREARAEVDRVLEQPGDPDQPISISREQLDSMVVLGSIIEEALRLSSASIMIRVANEDSTITLDSGDTAAIRKGDYIALYPQLIHMDPEIYPNPTEFQFDRFLDNAGQRRSLFYKNGRRLKHFLVPFGSGVSECPGRFFAVCEIKIFLALVLWHYDLELGHSNTPLTTDCTRAGLGILPPTQDVLLRYRVRPRASTSDTCKKEQHGEGDSDETVELTE